LLIYQIIWLCYLKNWMHNRETEKNKNQID
jgi:hypothetical protein